MYRMFTTFIAVLSLVSLMFTPFKLSAGNEMLPAPKNIKSALSAKSNTQVITSHFTEKASDKLLSNNTYYFEDFNKPTPPSDITTYDIDGLKPVYNNWNNAPWVLYLMDEATKDYDMISTSYYNPAGQADDWLITPKITIGEDAYLSWEANSWYPGRQDGYEVRVSTTGADVADFDKVLFSTPAENVDPTLRFVDLSAAGIKDQDIYIAFRNNSYDKYVLSIDNIAVYKPDTYDVQMLSITLPKYMPVPGSPYTINGTFRNMGTETITNFTLLYTDNGGEPVECQITDVNIPLHTTFDFSHSIDWTTDQVGEHNIKVWVSKINGNNDQFPGNDALSGVVLAYDVEKTFKRYPMIECFTSATCPPCNPGNIVVENILKKHPGDYVIAKYQMNWPGNGDIYFNTDGNMRRNYYAIDGVPTMFVDGMLGINSNVFTDQMFLDAQSSPAFLKLEANYSVTDKTVNINASILSKIAISKNDMVLHCAILEGTTYKNVATNGETEFHNVEKAMVPSGAGTPIKPLAADEKQEFSLTYTFPENNTVEEFDDLFVAVFLQNRTTKEIYNATFAVKEATGVYDKNSSGSGIVRVFPNPATQMLNLDYLVNTSSANVKLMVYNLNGELVLENNLGAKSEGIYSQPVNISKLTSGDYLLELHIDAETFINKLSVVR